VPTLTNDQLSALAQTGALNREIEAALGREMTDAERAIVDRARVVWRLKRKAKRDRGPISDREKHNKANQADRLIPFRDPATDEVKRRAKLERDPAAWLRWYLPERFPLPFGPVHHDIIRACVRAMSGTSLTVAAPRGFGKTAILWGMALYGVMTGRCRFPVVIGWKQSAGAELLSQWLDALSDNDRLAAGYPCVCDIFRDSTASKRVQGLLRNLDPFERTGADVRKGRGTVLLPETREAGRTLLQAALAGASMNGSIKGLNVGLLTGESLRPDMVMMDDPQDEATACSDALVAKVIRKIDYGLRSLSGPQRRLTMMAAVTCVDIGDVSEHLLTRPGTEAIRCGQVASWPAGWTDKDSASRSAWDEWNRVRLGGLESKDNGRAARGYYRKHKRELTQGMAVTWRYRYHVGDAERPSDPDALFAAMWDFYDLGELAFMAERQNAPIKQGVTLYNLTPAVIESRSTNRDAGDVPDWVRLKVCGTDINPSYGLTWALVGFGSDQTAAVLGYGIYPMSVAAGATEVETARAIYEALVDHGRALAALPCRPDAWMIDAGGAQFDIVNRFAAESARLGCVQAWATTGQPAEKYKPFGQRVVGQPREQVHRRQDERRRTWLAWNSHYWHEMAQKAWTGSPGAPGSCSLPAGHHREFAEQVCRDQLRSKGTKDRQGRETGVLRWDWVKAPGRNDYGDAMAMAYMGAAWAGIGTGGQVVKQAARPKQRRIRHVTV
jgi:hypothetical protein